MIFAVLGVVILIISFVVALISLIKEQNQLVPKVDEGLGDNSQVTAPAEPVYKPTDQLSNQPVKNIPATSEDLATSDADSVPFPWEQNFQEETAQEKSLDEKRIEEIQAKLNQIKSQGSQDNPTSDEGAKDVNAGDDGRLNGGFSLSDIAAKESSQES